MNDLCFNYYYSQNILFLYTRLQGQAYGLHAYDCDFKTNWKCSIHSIINKELVDSAIIDNTVPFIAKNVQLPSKINNIICNLYSLPPTFRNKKQFNIIFKCGGLYKQQKADCHAIIYDTDQFYKHSVAKSKSG